MASQVEICNIALTMLGADVITTIGENSTNAKRLNAVYDSILDEVLREHTWNFASTRASLARLSSTPAFGYDYEHQLPVSCLKVIAIVSGDALLEDYKIEGRKVLSNYTDIKMKYIDRVVDPNQYDTQFKMVLATRLAAELAYPITNNKANATQLFELYMERLRLAKASDAQESSSTEKIDDDLWTVEYRQ